MTHPVHIRGLGAYLPAARLRVEDLVASGRYDPARAEADGFTGIAVEPDLSPPEMALEAARALVDRAEPEPINTLYYCSIHRHGHKALWPAANGLQRHLGLGSTTRAIGLTQGCIGGFSAVSLACDMIGAGVPGDHLVTGADRFEGSGFDRINSDLGTLYGDAAFALRLGRAPGPFRLRYFGMASEPELEAMYRTAETGAEGPLDHDIKSAKKAYLARHGRDHFNQLFLAALDRLRGDLLAQEELRARPARYIIYPNVGAGLSAQLYARVFGDLAQQDHWRFGRSIGHLGTADQFLGLWHLHSKGDLKRGDQVLLLGAGNGLNLAAMLVEKT